MTKKINLSELSLTELSYNESSEIMGGSVFTQVGYWIGRGLESAQHFLTTPLHEKYPDHESWV